MHIENSDSGVKSAMTIHTTEKPPVTPPSARQTALYTRDMLRSLKKLAAINRQEELAALIEAAAAEAENLVKQTE